MNRLQKIQLEDPEKKPLKTDFRMLRESAGKRPGQPLPARIGKVTGEWLADLSRFLGPSQLSTTMCRNYGHVIASKWEGTFPHCNCLDSRMLRRAEPIKNNTGR